MNGKQKIRMQTVEWILCFAMAVCVVASTIRIYQLTSPKGNTTNADNMVAALSQTIPDEPIPMIVYDHLGEFKLTAYCGCEKCCGKWGQDRPTDENGDLIVYTANQTVAKEGITIAADTNIFPFGTILIIDGHEYTVQDRGKAITGNHIDIYFESHEEAVQFGVQYKDIFMRGEM